MVPQNFHEIAHAHCLGPHVMLSDGLREVAANAVELVVDDRTGIGYGVYLASQTRYGESSELVRLVRFPILQPTNCQWVTVFDHTQDFGGSPLSECNLLELDRDTLRVFALDMGSYRYYYKDVDKNTLRVGPLEQVFYLPREDGSPVPFSREDINGHLLELGKAPFPHLQFTTPMAKVDGWFYTTICGGNATEHFLFARSRDGRAWTFRSVVSHPVNYEAMLAYHAGKFWVMCRNGFTAPTDQTRRHLLCSPDGLHWTLTDLELTVSDTRPYLFTYQGALYLAYSSPLPEDYSTVRPWRCNLHVGRLHFHDGHVQFQQILYKKSKFGIVYYALTDFWGKMILLYSSGELHPTEGLIQGWSSGKDCLNYSVVFTREPELRFDPAAARKGVNG